MVLSASCVGCGAAEGAFRMTAETRHVIKKLHTLLDEIYIAAINCGHRSCPVCQFNCKCADAIEAAIGLLQRGA